MANTKSVANKITKAEADKVAEAIAASGPGEVEIMDPEQAAREIVERILSAPDVEAVAAIAATTKSEDVIGRWFELRGVRFSSSAFDEGPQVYALLDVADNETGEILTVTCGSRNVMAQALRLLQLGALPSTERWAIVRAERPSASGFYPMWLLREGVAPV